jgi:DNA polymerase-3 subunit beta
MRFVTNTKGLRAAVTAAAAVTAPKASMAILGCVKISATDGHDVVELTGTDTYTTVVACASSKIEQHGSCVVEAKLLRDVVSSLPDSDSVHVEIDGAKMLIRVGKSRRQVACLDAQDYPMLAQAPDSTVLVEGPALLRALATVEHAMCTEESRTTMNGVSVACGGGKVVAQSTDGHRACRAEIECETGEVKCFVPSRGVAAMKRGIADADAKQVQFGANATHAVLVSGDITTTMRLHDAEFAPRIGRMFDAAPKAGTVASRAMLLDALRRVRVTAKQADKERADAVVLTVDGGEIRITTHGVRGESVEVVPCDYGGERLVIGFDPDYLIEPLSALACDDVLFAFRGALDAAGFRPALTNEVACVVMPQRVA